MTAIYRLVELESGSISIDGVDISKLRWTTRPMFKTSNPIFDDGMLIVNGGIIFGFVKKKIVGAYQGGLVHVVFREKSPETARIVVHWPTNRRKPLGKRVDFSARTVITGDPNLELDKVVTPYNIAYLQELVRNGPSTYPGALHVVRDAGERIDLRHLKDGDFVLFNRQPSLHKMNHPAFRMNLSVTPPYNTDFDGDEMNMHVPQSEETRAELSQIAWVPRQIISPQANKPVMGIVQDTLCGVCKFTLRDTFLDWNQVQNILQIGMVPFLYQLFSNQSRYGLVNKSSVSLFLVVSIFIGARIQSRPIPFLNGDIIFGIVEKKTVGASQGGLGPKMTRQLFTGLRTVVNYWLFHNGFSIGIGDTIADKDTMSYTTETVASRKASVAKIIEDATHGRLKREPGMTIRESFESLVERELNLARDDTGQHVQRTLKEHNNVKQMVVTGSKGWFINISQMSICVGQQSVEGRRIPFGFRHRTLPHFTKDNFSPESRGFVENSYLRGLTPQEFFFHAMAGREGLIDTAVKTAETGYIQRRLVKALEDVMVCYDGTVRNSLGDLIQFVYGEDGMDEFEHNYRVDVTDPTGGFLPGMLQLGIDDSSLELQKKLDEEYDQLVADRRLLRNFIFPRFATTSNQYLPVNLSRIVQNTAQIFHIDRRKSSDLDPIFIIDSVKALCDRLIVVRSDDPLSREAQANATLQFHMHLRATFDCRRVLERFHLNKEAFEWVMGESLINPSPTPVKCVVLLLPSPSENPPPR
ncbi:beta and beta-prime subunits of DNA dependent RNA-polymerase [Gymnopus androsaceus JB14]|uniref:DNA-directed RNA polymerase n=1 Tax=Gymnopus androsaceus JB14 TaxID=1447944 RepID=A0A6A4GGL8_9AGAR|nr:beta and beta-prime subunits of DNA dependent RNA-polymerase [Gymnopus androsaceus JB14]